MKISILLPTRNRLEYLRFAVESVRRQAYADWEIVVSDNFSEDDIVGYVRSLNEPRVVYHRTRDFISVTDNWNNALEKSSGDYIIMLGDDDALLSGCLARLDHWIAEYNHPDLIYLGGLVYSYPNIVPTSPESYVQLHSYGYFIRGASSPFWLEDDEALALVKATMNFKVAIDYNMQFSVISRMMIKKMSQSGPFFRSPFPDYYATNILLLEAKRRLMVPTPLVAVGVTPKSYGFFHSNQHEKGGIAFLNNLPANYMQNERFLPGTNINTSWLLSLEEIKAQLTASEPSLEISYSRYRLLQIVYVYQSVFVTATLPPTALDELHSRLGMKERWFLAGPLSISFRLLRRISPSLLRRVAGKIGQCLDQFPAGRYWPERSFQGKFSNIVELFEQIDPETLLTPKR